MFGVMDVTKVYKFIGFGAMYVTKPYKFIGFGAMDVTKPYKFIGSGAMDVTKPYKFIGSGVAAIAGVGGGWGGARLATRQVFEKTTSMRPTQIEIDSQ